MKFDLRWLAPLLALLFSNAHADDAARDKSPDPDDWYQNEYAPLWQEAPWDKVDEKAAYYDTTVYVRSGSEEVTAEPGREWLETAIAGWKDAGWLGSAVANYRSDRLNATTVSFKVKWRDWYADEHEEFSCGWYLADLKKNAWVFTQYAEIDCAAHDM